MPSLKSTPESVFNFLRFHAAIDFFFSGGKLGYKESGVFIPISKTVTSFVDYSESDRLPNNYNRGSGDYNLPIVINEEVVFQLNFALTSGAFSKSTTEIAIINSNGVAVYEPFGAISKLGSLGTDSYFSYIKFTIPNINVKEKSGYRVIMYDSVDRNVYYISSEFKQINSSDKRRYTHLQYRNSSNLFGFNYESFEDYQVYQKHRFDFNLIEENSEITVKSYREQTTGIIRNQKTQTANVVKLEAFFISKYDNDMMIALSVHDQIILNGKLMALKTAYKASYNLRNNKWKGEIELYDQMYSTINLNGNGFNTNSLAQGYLQLETGDYILQENGQFVLNED